jgi:hypothetical protein
MLKYAGHAASTKQTRNAYKILLKKVQRQKIAQVTQERLKRRQKKYQKTSLLW